MTSEGSKPEQPRPRIPDFLEERVLEILGEPETQRQEALRALLDSVPEHASSIRRWLSEALDQSREADRELAETLGLFEPHEERPERIGPYRILESIGHGGMGSVYLAEQMELLRRRVALKLIKLGMDTQEVIARFEAERQALALMNHPNIARVYDAGVTEQGRPYFVMEYVPGVPMTQYCDTHRLTLRDRLELFIQVCEAVKHAHQRGVIHRDLKPSNVLVMRLDGKPVPKIIDFGVAKATNQRLTEQTIFTQQGRIIGTPEYMSPEQAETSGLEVDARTDVYSLGVVLYELLCGLLPFERDVMRKAGLLEIHRIIREVEPPRPSLRIAAKDAPITHAAYHRRMSPKQLLAELRGALDWVAMTAMEKDPARRYASADALATDCARYLHDEPVSAGPPSSVYRLRTFVRRRRVLLRLGAVVLVLVLVSLWALTRQGGFLRSATRDHELALEAIAERDATIGALQTEVARVRRDLEAARVALAAKEEVTGTDPTQVAKLVRERDAARTRVSDLETALARRTGELEAAARLAEQMRTADDLVSAVDRVVRQASTLGFLLPEQLAVAEGWLEGARERAQAGAEFRRGLGAQIEQIPAGSRLALALETLGDDARGLLAVIAARVAQGRTWGQQSLQAAQGAWVKAIERVASPDGPYANLRLAPRAGLVPLGPDKTTRLEEFAFLPSGTTPQRDADGKLTLGDETALVFVLLPNGEVDMGGSKIPDWQAEAHPKAGPLAHPMRTVLLTSFYVSKYEMTQGQWVRVSRRANPSTYAAGQVVDGRAISMRHPVETVAWDTALEELAPWAMTLPTEAQWEYAARARTFTTWYTGNDVRLLRDAANLLDRSGVDFGLNIGGTRYTESDGWAVHAPVGMFTANAFGLFDVHGNVSEWCLDWLAGYDLDHEPHTGLSVARSGTFRVHRGGSYQDRASAARSRYRNGDLSDNRLATVGVRPVINR